MTSNTAPGLDPSTRARLAASVSKRTARLEKLRALEPHIVANAHRLTGRLEEADRRRSTSGLALVEQHISGQGELAEARLSHNLNCLANTDTAAARSMLNLLRDALVALRAERDALVAGIAADEKTLAGAAA